MAGWLESSLALNAIWNNPYTVLVSVAVVLLSLLWIVAYQSARSPKEKVSAYLVIFAHMYRPRVHKFQYCILVLRTVARSSVCMYNSSLLE